MSVFGTDNSFPVPQTVVESGMIKCRISSHVVFQQQEKTE